MDINYLKEQKKSYEYEFNVRVVLLSTYKALLNELPIHIKAHKDNLIRYTRFIIHSILSESKNIFQLKIQSLYFYIKQLEFILSNNAIDFSSPLVNWSTDNEINTDTKFQEGLIYFDKIINSL